ncbi:MAG: VWA domain-containing protein [Planctomycetia bacterium]|nr:VWA domain-containing protein [Planctomycetia bacterium]
MSLYFTHPVWLWLVAPMLIVLALAWSRNLTQMSPARTRCVFALRCCVLLALLGALAGLALAVKSDRRETLFLIDASDSIDPSATQLLEDYLARAHKADPTALMRTIYFAQAPSLLDADALDDALKSQTDLQTALTLAYASLDPTRRSQIVLLSDGVQTQGDFRQALYPDAPCVSTVPLPRNARAEVQLVKLNAPNYVRQGEPYQVEAIVLSSVATDGSISLFQQGLLVEKRQVELQQGENRFLFQARAEENQRNLELLATLDADDDYSLDNNAKSAYVIARGKPQILALSKVPERLRNLTAALRAQDVTLQTRPASAAPSSSMELQQFDAVILADVASTDLTEEQTAALRLYVKEFGGGLLVTGGENAFGGVGYARTPLDDVLPVKANFEKDKEKPSLAIALVLDRSGSMDGDKLELTKDAAKGVVELLAPQDYIDVIAFDDAPREIVPIQNATSATAVSQMIGALVADGSTNIYPALSKATDDLMRVNAKFKHIILLTDGQSVPGDYDSVVRRAAGDNITISSVGIGSDCDRFLLEKLASDGKGRYYQCDDPRYVPQIFARETKLADKSNLEETPFLVMEDASAYKILGNIDLELAPPLLGHVVVETKPTAERVLSTETDQPLMVLWRFGLGYAAVFTSDVDGRWSKEWLDWQDFAPFWAQTLRFLQKQSDDANSQCDVRRENHDAVVTIDAHDPYGDALNGAQLQASFVDKREYAQRVDARQLAPGVYRARAQINLEEPYALQVANCSADGSDPEALALERIFSLQRASESDVRPVDEDALKAIAQTTGGRFNPQPEELPQIAQGTLTAPTRSISLRLALLLIALIAYALDVYARRGLRL